MFTMRIPKPRSGSVLVMTTFGLIFILGMLALVTDIGWLYYQKARIQTAVNAAWRAGIDAIILAEAQTPGERMSACKARVEEIYKMHGYTAAPAINTDTGLRVRGAAVQPLFFARIMQMNQSEVAAVRQGDGGEGVVPLGLMYGDIVWGIRNNVEGYYYRNFNRADQTNPSEGYVEGEEYILKLGPQKGSKVKSVDTVPLTYNELLIVGGNSNEGALRLDGNGKSVWLDNMLYGCPSVVNIGDMIDTEPGNFTGPTKTAKEARMGDIVVVPIIEVPGKTTTIYNEAGMTEVRVIGFARMEITGIDTTLSPDLGVYTVTQIRGKFIEYLIRPT